MRYVSDKVISFSIRVKGKADSVRVNFLASSNGGSSFSTDSAVLAEALEKSRMYGVMYKRAPECVFDSIKKSVSRKSDAGKRVLMVPEVLNWQDAIDYLSEQCGSVADKLVTPDAILKEASLKGIKFPNLG